MTAAKRPMAPYQLGLLAGLLALFSWNRLGAPPATPPVLAPGIAPSADSLPTPEAKGPAPPAGATPLPTDCGPGMGAWTLQAPYPIPVANAAVAAQDGLLYSFG